MANKYVKVKIPLPQPIEDKSIRSEVAELIIERIVERTISGKDVDGNNFPKYSTSYKNSLDFANAGKDESTVNLELSGDMLASLAYIKKESDDKHIVIGFDDESVEGRAEGNIRGSYGKDKGSRKLSRDFLGTSGFTKNKGVSDKDLGKIIKYVIKSNK